jgi:hypothetical protein
MNRFVITLVGLLDKTKEKKMIINKAEIALLALFCFELKIWMCACEQVEHRSVFNCGVWLP